MMHTVKTIAQHLLGYVACKANGVRLRGKCYIGMGTKIVNRGEMEVCDGVRVGPSSWMCTGNKKSKIVLGAHANIGTHSTLSAHNQIVIGGVLTGPHVFISDHNHEYGNPQVPVCRQGVRAGKGDRVEIGEGTWLGTNVVVVGNVRIGRNCVVGANSVVTRDIPDCCVAVGSPAKVVKRYDAGKKDWVRI